VHPQPTPSCIPDDDAKKDLTDKGNDDDIVEEGIESNEVKHNIYHQPSVHGDAGWWSTIFFSWAFQLVK